MDLKAIDVYNKGKSVHGFKFKQYLNSDVLQLHYAPFQ